MTVSCLRSVLQCISEYLRGPCWSPAVRPVYCRRQLGRCQTRSAAAPVCGRVCVTTSVNDVALAVDRLRLARCVSDVGYLMSLSRLRLNSSKTGKIWLEHKNRIDKTNIRSVPALSSSVSVVDSVRDVGVVIDSRSTMSDHVTAFCRSGYYQPHQLRPVARALPEAAAKTL